MAPTNVYFDTGTQSEQDLYEAIAIEQIKSILLTKNSCKGR